MKNLFCRIKHSLEADIHGMLDQKEQKNPISSLNNYLRQCEQEAEKVRKLVERQQLLKEEFSREFRHAQDVAEKRKDQAVIASKANETELYQFLVREQAQYEERANRLQGALQTTENQLHDLEQKYEDMKHKLKDMTIRQMEFMGRENVVHAHQRMNQFSTIGGGSDSPFSRFEEMENYIHRLEQKVNSSYFRHTIDARIEELEKQLKIKETDSVS